MLRQPLHFIAWVTLAALLCGCAEKPAVPPPVSGADGLKELVGVYTYLEYSKVPPPKQVGDLAQYIDSLPNALPRLQTGEYEIIWGTGLASTPPASGGVLAFETKTPISGGAVLFRDGAVREMSPLEFAAALKIQ